MLAEDELRDAVLLIFANKQVWTIKCLFYSILLYYIKIASLTMYLYLLPVSKSCAFPRYLSFCLPVLSLRLSYSLMCFSPLLSFHLYLTFGIQDLPNAMNAAEITDKLGLHSLRHRNWYIQATCATSGDGLYEGLDWLANQLKNKK